MMSRSLLAFVFIFITAAASFGQALVSAPTFSPNPGVYDNPFNLSINHPDNSVTIRFTTNGSEPTANSPVFSGHIVITDRTGPGADTDFARIRTTPPDEMLNDGAGDLPWMSPSGDLARGTVIRAAAFRDGNRSQTITGSFFVFPQNNPFRSLPIVSVIVDSSSFFGHNLGIQIPGANYRDRDSWTGNYYQRGDDWERPGNFEFFNRNGNLAVSQTVGYRIHGGWTRRFPQKSLRVYARRGEYGERDINFKERLFHYRPDSSFRRLLLRTGGNDVQVTLLRDASAQYMLSHVKTFDTQGFRSVIKFINGEFWGWYNIRERLDKHYLNRVYGVDPDNIDHINFSYSSSRGSVSVTASEGDTLAYNRMVMFARNVRNNQTGLTSQEVLDSMFKLIDIDSYVDYYAVQMLLGNTDGIYNNHRMWRERRRFENRVPGETGRDGRFRWLVFDLDQILNIWNIGDGNGYRFDQIYSSSNPGNEMFRNLMGNKSIEHHFVNSFANLLNTAFHSGNRTDSVIDSIAGTMRPVMDAHVRRWRNPLYMASRENLSSNPNVAENWEGWLNDLKSKYRSRIGSYRNTVRDYFGAGSDRNITFVTDTTYGLIKVNSMVIDPRMPTGSSQRSWSGRNFTWSGDYFANIPITVSGVGKPNYRIQKWIIKEDRFEVESTDSIQTISLTTVDAGDLPVCSQQCTIRAVFEYYEPIVSADHKISRSRSAASIKHRVHSRSNVTFNFTLPEAGNVQLRVYNLAGKEVGRVANGKFGAGSHQLNWKSENMAAGVYIYRLRVNNNIRLDGRLRI